MLVYSFEVSFSSRPPFTHKSMRMPSHILNTYKQHIAKTPAASQLSLSTGSTLAEVRTAAHVLET